MNNRIDVADVWRKSLAVLGGDVKPTELEKLFMPIMPVALIEFIDEEGRIVKRLTLKVPRQSILDDLTMHGYDKLITNAVLTILKVELRKDVRPLGKDIDKDIVYFEEVSYYVPEEKSLLERITKYVIPALGIAIPAAALIASLLKGEEYKVTAEGTYFYYSLPDTVENSIGSFELSMPEQISETYPLTIIDNLKKIQSLWVFKLHNSGKLVNEITFEFPPTGFYRIIKHDSLHSKTYFHKAGIFSNIDEKIIIKNMAQHATFTIIIWSDQEANNVLRKDIKASHVPDGSAVLFEYPDLWPRT